MVLQLDSPEEGDRSEGEEGGREGVTRSGRYPARVHQNRLVLRRRLKTGLPAAPGHIAGCVHGRSAHPGPPPEMAALRGWLALTLLVVLVSTGSEVRGQRSEVRGQGSGVTGRRTLLPVPPGMRDCQCVVCRWVFPGVAPSGAFSVRRDARGQLQIGSDRYHLLIHIVVS